MINKEKNINLQITISKDAFKKLEEIIKHLKGTTGLDLTKSQAIEYMITISEYLN